MSDTTEQWRPIPEWEGWYEVSLSGRVRSVERRIDWMSRWGKPASFVMPGRELTAKLLNGYWHVHLRQPGRSHGQYVHRAIAAAFLGLPDPNAQVNHKNGIKTDNRLDNLEWVTQRQNQIHARDTGLFASGERNGMTKLTEQSVREIRSRYAAGENSRKLASEYAVSPSQIHRITTRQRWARVA